MTRLTLFRHAKSSWKEEGQPDMERPLNERGLRDAPMMGSVLADMLPPPNLVMVSPARRARDSVKLLLEGWGLEDVPVMVIQELYSADVGQWRALLSRDDVIRNEHVLVCAHQPGLGDFAVWLCSDFQKDLPTAAVLSVLMGPEGIKEGMGRLDYRDWPKAHIPE